MKGVFCDNTVAMLGKESGVIIESRLFLTIFRKYITHFVKILRTASVLSDTEIILSI